MNSLRDENRTSGKVRCVKVYADSVRPATCRVCQQPVTWAKAVTRSRWVLFDGSVAALKRRVDGLGRELLYFGTAAIHWNHCCDSRTRESERQPARGRSARA